MPSIYTHTVFASDVKNKLDKKTKTLIDEHINFYNMFSQSFDNLYYYNFLSFKKGNDIRKLGGYCHRHKTQNYFMNMIKYIKDNNLQDNSEVLCYLYGSINHYVSDSTFHPFITFKTGRYSQSRKEQTKKYIGIHTNTEIRIDAYYYEKINKKRFKQYKIYNELIHKLTFSKELLNTIDYTFKETFKKENMGKIFNRSYNQSKNIYRILMYDRFGIKLFFYQLIDFLFPNKDKKIASFSLYKEPIEETFFNRKHNYWCNPVDMDLISDDSWDDLYKKALKKAVKFIEATNLYLENKITENKYKKIIGNNHYGTGLDCTDKRIIQYFEI